MILTLAVAGASLVGSLSLRWPLAIGPAAVAVAGVAALCPRQLSRLFNKWLWATVAISILLPIWLVGLRGEHGDGEGVSVSWTATCVGLTLALRVLTTLAALILIGGSVSPLWLHGTVGRFLGKDLATACAIGVNLLPAVMEILSRTVLAMRLRGGFRRHRLANIRRLAVAVGVQTVRLTEDVAEALVLSEVAAARAKDVVVADRRSSPRQDDDLPTAC
jgi:energy-coupling factor transporter transmembrane protein EcfT